MSTCGRHRHRRPLILHSFVQQVADKLLQSSNISPAAIQQANETYRLLETRVSVGSLGKQDRSLTRAASVLMYVLRRQTSSNSKNPTTAASVSSASVSWEQLATAVGTTQTNLKNLFQQIGNYLQSPQQQQQQPSDLSKKRKLLSTTTTSSSSSSHQQLSSSSSGLYSNSNSSNNKNRSRVMGNMNNTSLISDLSIRLAARVVDPRGCAQRAVSILQEMQRQYTSTTTTTSTTTNVSAAERRGYLYDMNRYWTAYQAAAFYCAATANNKNNNNNKNSSSKNKANKKRGTKRKNDTANNTNDNEDNDDDDDDDEDEGNDGRTSLDLQNLADASTEFTYLELKEVLPHVQTFAVDLQKKDKATTTTTTLKEKENKQQPPGLIGIGRNRARHRNKDQQENHYNSSSTTTEQTLASLLVGGTSAGAGSASMATDNNNTSNDDDRELASFRKWETEILSTLLDQAKEKLVGQEGNEYVHVDEITQEMALEFAANEVLLKYNLLLLEEEETTASITTTE